MGQMWAEDGPSMGTEVDPEDLSGLSVRNARGAGLHNEHRHHLLPQELERQGFYSERGFAPGEIHNYTTPLPQSDHEAIHGGGNYRLAKEKWPEGSWNERLKGDYKRAEAVNGDKMTKEEILRHMERMRKLFGIADGPVGAYGSRR
jgi:hypothetical protein